MHSNVVALFLLAAAHTIAALPVESIQDRDTPQPSTEDFDFFKGGYKRDSAVVAKIERAQLDDDEAPILVARHEEALPGEQDVKVYHSRQSSGPHGMMVKGQNGEVTEIIGRQSSGPHGMMVKGQDGEVSQISGRQTEEEHVEQDGTEIQSRQGRPHGLMVKGQNGEVTEIVGRQSAGPHGLMMKCLDGECSQIKTG